MAVKRFSLVSVALLAGCSAIGPVEQITQTLDAQAGAWSRGDLDGFMNAYWMNDDLTFVAFPRAEESKATTQPNITRGWKAVSQRYHARYRDAAEMGTLSFLGTEVKLIDRDTATVTGRYEVRRAGGIASTGYFILDMVLFKDGWKIVRDRTYPD